MYTHQFHEILDKDKYFYVISRCFFKKNMITKSTTPNDRHGHKGIKKGSGAETVPLPLYSIDLSEIIRLQEFRPLRYLQQKGSLRLLPLPLRLILPYGSEEAEIQDQPMKGD